MQEQHLFRRPGARFLWLAVALLAISACQHDVEDPFAYLESCTDGPSSSIDMVSVGFAVQDKFHVDSTSFIQGETIRFVCTVRNNGSTPVTLYYTRPACELLVRSRSSGVSVWDPYYGQAFAQVVTSMELAPGESSETVFEWDMVATPELAADVPPGVYRVEPLLFVGNDNGEARLERCDGIDFVIQ